MDKKDKKERYRTQAVQDNINPIFYQTIDISYNLQDRDSLSPIIMDVFDSDAGEALGGLMDGDDDFLARAIIHLKDASVADFRKQNDDKYLNTPPKPKWHKLRAGNQSTLPECGEILCSFSLVPPNHNFKPAREIQFIKPGIMNEYTVDIHCLGLRGLKSFGILPVRKAFIKFNVRGMLPPHMSLAVKNVKTEPKESGSNPNINTLI
jgi:hypothetical protein